MQKAGFITELPSDPAPAAAPSPSEEQAMKQQLERTLAEQHIEWNDLKTRSRQKEIELAALRTNLEEVRREGEQDALESHLTTSECESVTTRRVLYFPFSEQTLFESQQLAHVLRRSQVSITSRKAAILHLQREIHSVLSMHSTANENVGELEAHCLTSLKELRAVQRHKVSLEDEFADNRTSGLASLEFQHRAMSEELTEAKQQKAKQLTIQSNIEKLKAWLGRQREARKVMRLYIGLEKMGRRRIKRVLETVIRGCGGNTLDEALSNYSFTLSRNSSLIHEAEYKLAQQASCILRLSSMLSELQYLTSRLSSESASSLLFRVHKTDIYEAPALMRVRLAEMTINEYEQKWKLLKLLVGKAVDSFAGMLGLLQTADPWNRGSARTNDLIPMKNPIAAVLLVEKKIVFAYERIVPWMAAFSQPPHLDSHFSHIRTRGHLDSTKSRPSVVPRSSTFLDGLTGRGVSLMVRVIPS